jgi:Na+-translocating ferredoxin:NAD+ oxidoreductase RnfD subunit
MDAHRADGAAPGARHIHVGTAVARVLLQVVTAGLLAVGGIAFYFSVGALLAGDAVAIESVLTTVGAFALAAVLIRRLRRPP